jgi:hypothetical protein
MSFTKKPERPMRRSKGTTFRGASVPSGLLVRTVLVGLVAIAGAAWALARHYTHTLPPMRVPVTPVTPREVPTFDADAGEFPVPDLFVPDGEAR